MQHRVEPEVHDHMTTRARELRKEASVPERLLWGLLRNRRLGGLKFRRQQPVGAYVVDYFCEAAQLVIELDGESHTRRESEDARRDAYLRERGLTVLRIPNDDLLRNRVGVAETILREVEEVIRKPSP